MYAGTKTLCIRYDFLLDVLLEYTREQVSEGEAVRCRAVFQQISRASTCTKLPVRLLEPGNRISLVWDKIPRRTPL
jgi:hypothetical protein